MTPIDRPGDSEIVEIEAALLEELRRDQHMLKFFLDRTTDHVYFKDLECRFIRTSRSNALHLGLNSADEAIGKSDFDFFDNISALEYYENEQKIIRSGEGVVDIEEHGVHDDGREGWSATSKMQLLDEAGNVIGTFGTSRDITRRKEVEESLRLQNELNEHQSLHDALTGLPNRRLYRDRIDQAILATEREGGRVAVLLVDLDRFKEINDTLGHHAGDELLRQVAARMRSALRATDTVARLGGDEFGILLPRFGEPGDIIQLIDKLTAAIEAPIELEDLPIAVEASIGVAIYPDDAVGADELLQRADVAMYVAKNDNTPYSFYDKERDTYDPIRLSLVSELRRAIAEEELVLYYQPKATLATGKIGSVEALLRWNHPERGLVMPDEFIPHAQETGLMKPLTQYVVQQACRQARSWIDDGLELAISVNVSTRNLIDVEFPAEVKKSLDENNLEARFLQLEITESTMLEDPFRTKVVLEKLRALGVHLAIDDFGTGYSSLAYLKNLPVHEIKIDRSFVMKMDEDADGHTIVRSAIDLGRNLGFEVTAEGVETEGVWKILQGLGCDTVQGYFLTQPIPPDELAAWLIEKGERSASPSLSKS
jgi:diguanylate cyclase (GGDEF)-like protein/PAS domain S-box-containing protein